MSAVVAEVDVDRSTGEIRVPKFYVAHDCGQIINPDGLKNQIEGCVVQTVSRTLIEELKFNRSQVTSLDWESYPILKFPQVPEIVVDLIDRPTEKPWGAGEPAASVISFGDLERGVRCNRRASAFDSLHTGQGESGDAGKLRGIRSLLQCT